MGKSAHKSRKRRRSHSTDRLADLDNKMSRLIDMLSQSEVRSPSGPSPSDSEAVLAPLVRQEGLMDPQFSEVEMDVEGEDDTSLDHLKQVTIDELVTRKWCDLTHKGLATDQRELLLKKFTPSEALAFLKAPWTVSRGCKTICGIVSQSSKTSVSSRHTSSSTETLRNWQCPGKQTRSWKRS
ncbi:hypothetical protein ALC57_05772 [Trachymyrmex cornetzi]|uniref:Uncharacterized protein n=1 Tax=Trachymyrmex cornetzi TaxID=471704 RepID=A0A151J9V8_9HYME|nr:hypothetical protein ALC57_05772 [Trachymyrmex cornetzi]